MSPINIFPLATQIKNKLKNSNIDDYFSMWKMCLSLRDYDRNNIYTVNALQP